jgi:hypothetical protein
MGTNFTDWRLTADATCSHLAPRGPGTSVSFPFFVLGGHNGRSPLVAQEVFQDTHLSLHSRETEPAQPTILPHWLCFRGSSLNPALHSTERTGLPVPTPSLSSFASLGKSLHLPGFQFPHLQMRVLICISSFQTLLRRQCFSLYKTWDKSRV